MLNSIALNNHSSSYDFFQAVKKLCKICVAIVKRQNTKTCDNAVMLTWNMLYFPHLGFI